MFTISGISTSHMKKQERCFKESLTWKHVTYFTKTGVFGITVFVPDERRKLKSIPVQSLDQPEWIYQSLIYQISRLWHLPECHCMTWSVSGWTQVEKPKILFFLNCLMLFQVHKATFQLIMDFFTCYQRATWMKLKILIKSHFYVKISLKNLLHGI